MSQLIELEKNDVILTKDGREMRVLSIHKPDGIVRRCDCVQVDSESPMRTPIFADNIARILRKAPPMPKEPDMKIPDGQKVQAKDPVSEEIKKDVEARQAQKKKEQHA